METARSKFVNGVRTAREKEKRRLGGAFEPATASAEEEDLSLVKSDVEWDDTLAVQIRLAQEPLEHLLQARSQQAWFQRGGRRQRMVMPLEQVKRCNIAGPAERKLNV